MTTIVRILRRGLKTIHTPVHSLNDQKIRQQLISGIGRLNQILESSYNHRNILHKGKYKTYPQFVSSKDNVRFQKVIRDYLDSSAVNEIKSGNTGKDFDSKLATIGLNLFMDVNGANINPLASLLTYEMLSHYNKYPEKETIEGFELATNTVRQFLRENKIPVTSPDDILTLVGRLVHDVREFETSKEILEALNYNLNSDDIVRVVKGNKTFDEVEFSKGCRLSSGVIDKNELYLRSLDLPQKKLVSIDQQMCVLVYDGTLREANKILPTLHYLQKMDKKLLLLVTGECVGDALTAITIHNNKCKRQQKNHRTIIINYYSKDYGNKSIQENTDLQEFLKLPEGIDSIYSPHFSNEIPSKICADKYYGSIESLKATTGESYLYNDDLPESLRDKESQFLKQTVTLHVGGYNEFEIEQRRNQMDNLFNNFLCRAIADGFIPNNGSALCKSIPHLAELTKSSSSESLLTKSAVSAIMSIIRQYSERSIINQEGLSKFEAGDIISEITNLTDFKLVKTSIQEKPKDCSAIGLVEPWITTDLTLRNALNYTRLLASCNTAISLILEKPKKK